MKLDEIEGGILESGLSEESFSSFIRCLNRVRGSSAKCQHCYITAYKLRSVDHSGAVRLVQYGLAHFADSWFDRWNSFYYLGRVYEENLAYPQAKQSYLQAMAAVQDSPHAAEYLSDLALPLLRVEMHMTDFSISDDLEMYHRMLSQESAFDQGVRERAFYRALADLIIASHTQNASQAACAKRELRALLDPAESSPVDRIFKRHHLTNEVRATQPAIDYLRKSGVIS